MDQIKKEGNRFILDVRTKKHTYRPRFGDRRSVIVWWEGVCFLTDKLKGPDSSILFRTSKHEGPKEEMNVISFWEGVVGLRYLSAKVPPEAVDDAGLADAVGWMIQKLRNEKRRTASVSDIVIYPLTLEALLFEYSKKRLRVRFPNGLEVPVQTPTAA